MKREIVCPECEKELKELFPDKDPYPGEHIRFVDGNAKREMYCDHCLTLIQPGVPCCAFSIYCDARPYYNWEDGYLDVEN